MNAAVGLSGMFALGLLATMGLCLIAYGFFRLTRRNQERDWKLVRGRIVDRPDAETVGGSVPEIVYTYEYEGVNHRGTRVAPLPRPFFFRDSPQTLPTTGYGVGADVDVYVNPRNPAESVLDPAQQPWPAVEIVLIGVAAVLMSWVLWSR